MGETDPILLEIDRLIRLSRLREIEFIMSTDVAERVREIAAAVERLHPGEYLLGTGPSTVGIVPLGLREIVLGRPPTILEEPSESIADCHAVDTLYFVPREISRAHAKVVPQRNGSGIRHILIDLNSTCGTFVNETPVDPAGLGVVLRHGDAISLGPSQTSTYVYYRVEQSRLCGDPADSTMSWVWVPQPDKHNQSQRRVRDL